MSDIRKNYYTIRSRVLFYTNCEIESKNFDGEKRKWNLWSVLLFRCIMLKIL